MSQSAYKGIARYYHLLFEDWGRVVESEGQRLEAVLRPRGVESVLDMACGTGLQSIGLALKGFPVTGCDNSPEMVRVARKNAREAGVKVRFTVADMRSLADSFVGQFGAAISCGNSLAHLLTVGELERTFAGAFSILRPGGVCLVDAWDYESILNERPKGVYNRTLEVAGKRVIMYDTRTYGANQVVSTTFNLLRETDRGWRAAQFTMDLKAWRKEELVDCLLGAGFAPVEDLTSGGKVELLATKSAIQLKKGIDSVDMV